jgi:hypothetical protein
MDHDSDYLPIATSINLQIPQTIRASTRKWKEINGEAFQNTLQEKPPKLKKLTTTIALNRYTKKVAHAILKAAEAAIFTNNLIV